MIRYVFLSLIAVLSFGKVHSQVITSRQGSDSMKVVFLHRADRLSYIHSDSLTDLNTLAGNVKLQQGNTFFYCDSAVLNRKTQYLEAFGNVHIVDNDTVNIKSQYLQYFADTKIANLKNNVSLTDNKSTLFTNELKYDLNTKIGEYHNGGRLVNQQSVLTSKEGTYYEELKDVYFKKDVDLKDPQYTLKTDSLLYNTGTQVATFIAPTTIIDSSKRVINTSDGFYDTRNRKAFFGKRPVLKDKAVTIIADYIDTDDSTGISTLRGRAVYVDTAQGTSVLANLIKANNKEGSFVAMQHPLMILKQDKDSVYITADTLASGRLSKLPVHKDSSSLKPDSTKRIVADSTLAKKPAGKKQGKTTAANAPAKPTATENKNDSTDRYFMAWNHVRIFSDSMQAVSDSLFYSGKDSIFKLFTDPVMWASNSQITGDTIFLYTKNKNPDRLYVFENAFAVNLSDRQMYNQIKGNRLNGYFRDGAIDYMRAQGNAESIYYVKDEKNYLVGINNATSDIIDMRFKNKELNKVVFISEVTGTMYPIKQATEQNKLLRSFKWLEDKRPKTKFELFEDLKPVIIKDSTDSLQIEPPVVPGNKEQPKVDQPKEQSKQPVVQSVPPADKKEQAPFRKKTP
jgi:lipopolysaccharide export system protein LptA